LKRILVISDVHSNLTALEAVLADAGKFDETWCLGDLVGYGPDPNECVARIQGLPNLTCLMGNHDLAALDSLSLEAFNMEARRSILWQRERLSAASLDFLKSLPGGGVERGKAFLAHGSPRDLFWEYVLNSQVARQCLQEVSSRWCLVGHSHFQATFQYLPDLDDIQIFVLQVGDRHQMTERAILNPGSVGQPRDRNPRAAYAFFYPGKGFWEPRRVAYDFGSVQRRIMAAGLPQRHADRLSGGI